MTDLEILLFFVFVTVAAFIVVLSARVLGLGDHPEFRERRRWHRSRKPVSDEEYLAMFDSPVSPEVAFGVREVLMDALGVDKDEVYPDSQLVADLGAE